MSHIPVKNVSIHVKNRPGMTRVLHVPSCAKQHDNDNRATLLMVLWCVPFTKCAGKSLCRVDNVVCRLKDGGLHVLSA